MTDTFHAAVDENIYLPHQAVITDIIEESPSIRTYVLEFSDTDVRDSFSYMPGQFVMLSVPHQGEAPISISSAPEHEGFVHLSVRRAGRLTAALHQMKAGDYVGIRGPYGRPFPVDELKGKDLLFIAGGIGLAPLRSLIWHCLYNRREYGAITLLYGSRSPSDIAFRADIDAWKNEHSVDVRLTVDVAETGWSGRVGLVTELVDDTDLVMERSSAVLCGPPVMIDAVIARLRQSGMDKGDIIITLERNMKCGVGLCGHCHMEGILVCRHGPVFRVSELDDVKEGV